MRRSSQRARAILSAGAVALLATLTVYLTAGEPAPDPGSLLADRPAFPQLGAGEVDDGRSTDWRIRQGTRTNARDCSLGNGAYRAWSPNGGVLPDPVASQTVCAYKHELLARAVYKWQSLDGVAAQADWPNFESWSDTSPFTKNTKTLNLDADDWELGCGLGDPAALCRVWLFRGRYGRVLAVAELHSHVGAPGEGIPLRDMRIFVRSLDAHLAAKPPPS